MDYDEKILAADDLTIAVVWFGLKAKSHQRVQNTRGEDEHQVLYSILASLLFRSVS